MDSPGFEPGTLRMRSGCDTTTPQARQKPHEIKLPKNCTGAHVEIEITKMEGAPGVEPGTW